MYKQIIFFAVLATAQAQLVTNGLCDFTTLKIQINPNSTLPTSAVEISRISNEWQKGQCASWGIVANGTRIIMTEVVNRTLVQKNGTVDDGGNIEVNINFEDFSSNFTFLGVSSEYAILYACSNVGENKNEYIWILANSTTISESAKNETQDILTNNFTNLTLVDISHSTKDCETDGAANLKISSFLILLVGIAISKGL